MTNHPNRNRKHVLILCPRGFQNETIYISVSDEEFAEADAYLDTLVDDVDNTSRWLAPGRKLIARNGARIDFTWPRYKAEYIDPYK
jgi:hypothetical protein